MPTATRSELRPGRMLLGLLLIFGLAACGRGNQNETMTSREAAPPTGAVPPAAETAPPAPGTVPPGSGTATLSTPQIVEALSASDSAEIRPSQLAMQKSQNAEVKAYAQRMITDHGMLEDSLHALERQQNITPAPSPLSQQIDSQTQSMLQQLQGLSGAAFDQAYMQAMVQSHQAALNAVDTQLLPSAQDPQLRTALQQKVRPIIVAHLESAQAIQRSLGSSR